MYIEGLKSFLEPGMRRVRCEMERLLSSDVSLLGETNRSLLGSGGKGMRPGLALLLAGALGGVTGGTIRFAAATRRAISRCLISRGVISADAVPLNPFFSFILQVPPNSVFQI